MSVTYNIIIELVQPLAEYINLIIIPCKLTDTDGSWLAPDSPIL